MIWRRRGCIWFPARFSLSTPYLEHYLSLTSAMGYLLIFKEQLVALKGHDELRLVPAVSPLFRQPWHRSRKDEHLFHKHWILLPFQLSFSFIPSILLKTSFAQQPHYSLKVKSKALPPYCLRHILAQEQCLLTTDFIQNGKKCTQNSASRTRWGIQLPLHMLLEVLVIPLACWYVHVNKIQCFLGENPGHISFPCLMAS